MSKAEEMLALQLRADKIEGWVRECRFHPTRRWRFDFAWPDKKLAVEVEGITFYGKNKNGTMKLGRHQTGKGIEGDCIKYGEAMKLGWNVYRCTQGMVKSGDAIETIKLLLDMTEMNGDRWLETGNP